MNTQLIVANATSTINGMSPNSGIIGTASGAVELPDTSVTFPFVEIGGAGFGEIAFPDESISTASPNSIKGFAFMSAT
jgi:hypothetical protein